MPSTSSETLSLEICPAQGMIFGLSTMATWCWCSDQVNVNKNPLPQGPWWCLGSTSSARPPPPALLVLLARGLGGLLFGVHRSTLASCNLVLEVLGLGQFGDRDAQGCPHLLGWFLALRHGAEAFSRRSGLVWGQVPGCRGLAGAEGFALPVGLAACNGLFGFCSLPSVLGGPKGFLVCRGAGDLLARGPGPVVVEVCALLGKSRDRGELWLLGGCCSLFKVTSSPSCARCPHG